MNFYERYEAACRRAGVRPAAQSTVDMYDGTRAGVSVWKSKGVMPVADTVGKIATSLNTSADFLLGLTDDPDPNPATQPSVCSSPAGFTQLDAEDQAKVLGFIQGLLMSDKYQKKDEGTVSA